MGESAIAARRPFSITTRSAFAVQRCGAHPCPPSGCRQDEPQLSRTASGQAADVAPPIVNEVIGAPGAPLPAALYREMSAQFGYDFSGVRLHTGARAAESVDSVQARAYTVGQHIVLGRSMPDPVSAHGKRIMAHELAHVVQQPAAVPTAELPVSDPADAAELEAADLATRVTPSSAALSVQRDPDPQPGTGRNTAMREGIDPEKWSEALEAQYRARGDAQRAGAIRSCRENGGLACGIVLTNREMWNLYQLAQDSGGDEGKVRAGLAAAVPSLVPLMGPVPPVLTPPVLTPPVGVPPVFRPPVFTPPVFRPPVVTPPVSPGPAAGAGAGLSIEGAITIGGIAAIVVVCVIAGIELWQLGKFQNELRRRGLIILDDPLAVCIGGCHLPTRPPVGEFPRLGRGTGAQPWPGPITVPRPREEEDPQRNCQQMNPSALLCSGFSDRDEVVVEFLMSQGYDHTDLLDCEGFSSHPEGVIRECDSAPGQTWHCRIKGGHVVSVFACLCCNRDGSTGWEWRGAHWSPSTWVGR